MTQAATASTNWLNLEYDSLWHIKKFTQTPDNFTGTSVSETFTYENVGDAESATVRNYSRLKEMTYPDFPDSSATTVTNFYGSLPSASGDIHDRISRVTGLAWQNASRTASPPFADARYDFLGAGVPVVKKLGHMVTGAPPKSFYSEYWLDRSADPSTGSSTAGVYAGLDRFGRIARQFWGKKGVYPSDGTTPAPTAVSIDLKYTYDGASNITSRQDLRALSISAGVLDRDESYTYDGLQRLIQADRGYFSSGSFSAASGAKLSQKWELDTLGNWSSVATDINGNHTFESTEKELRGHDYSNELTWTLPGDQTPPATGTPGTGRMNKFDKVGNLLEQFTGYDTSVTPTAGMWRIMKYDAWNRLVEVQFCDRPTSGSSTSVDCTTKTRARYTYYALHQRATSVSDHDLDNWSEEECPAESYPDRYVLYFYDPSWRLLERRIANWTALDGEESAWSWSGWGSDVSGGHTFTSGSAGYLKADRVEQYFWGTTYIDELVGYRCRVGRASSGTYRMDMVDVVTEWPLLDRNFSVISCGSRSSTNHEQIRYSAYGSPTRYPGADLTNDGTVNTYDLGALVSFYGVSRGDTTPLAFRDAADLNDDGIINTVDLGPLLSQYGKSATPDELLSNGCVIGYDGYIWDDDVNMYLARARWFDPEMGRWINRDPVEYPDGMNAYQYVQGTPVTATDPSGLYGPVGHFWTTSANFVSVKIIMHIRYFGFYPSATLNKLRIICCSV